VTQDPTVNDARTNRGTANAVIPLYYALLEVAPTASLDDIRRAYRQKSKLYHPDTTTLPRDIAVSKFQELNKAYAVLSSVEQRLVYDRQQMNPSPSVPQSGQKDTYSQTIRTKSAYLDADERPLSPGELFALFILGLTFAVCLVIAVALGISRGEMALHATKQDGPVVSNSGPNQPLPNTIFKTSSGRSPLMPATKLQNFNKPNKSPQAVRSPQLQKQG
jgi:hypothetical protein